MKIDFIEKEAWKHTEGWFAKFILIFIGCWLMWSGLLLTTLSLMVYFGGIQKFSYLTDIAIPSAWTGLFSAIIIILIVVRIDLWVRIKKKVPCIICYVAFEQDDKNIQLINKDKFGYNNYMCTKCLKKISEKQKK